MQKGLVFLLLIFSTGCEAGKSTDTFTYRYNLVRQVSFNFSKSYSVDLGSITCVNEENRHKKWRYINNSPLAYLFNKKTGRIKMMQMVVHNAAPSKMDSIFWALLDSATYYYPVKPHSSTRLTAYLNLNTYPQPIEIIKYIQKNHPHLEYHIFNPENYPLKEVFTKEEIKRKISVKPDARINSIRVIR